MYKQGTKLTTIRRLARILTTLIAVPFFLAVLIAVGGFVFSYSYFPLRLYFTGRSDIDIVESKERKLEFFRNGMNISYFIIGRKTNYKYYVNGSIYDEVNPGDTFRVFVSDKISQRIYLGKEKLTVLTFILRYDEFSGIILPFLLGLTLLIPYILFCSILDLAHRISIDVRNESRTINRKSNTVILYGRAYTTFLTGIAFSYAFSFMIIKGVYISEQLPPIVAGCIIFTGIIISCSTPFILYYARVFIKGLNQKQFAYTLQLGGVLLSLYGTYKLFLYINDNSNFQDKDISKLLFDLLKSLIS